MNNLSTHNVISRKNILTRFLRISYRNFEHGRDYSIFLLTDRHFDTLEKKN